MSSVTAQSINNTFSQQKRQAKDNNHLIRRAVAVPSTVRDRREQELHLHLRLDGSGAVLALPGHVSTDSGVFQEEHDDYCQIGQTEARQRGDSWTDDTNIIM